MVEDLAGITYRQARRIAVFVVGSTVVLIGVLMIVLPGPAVIVVPMGLSILAIEFAWARRWLKHVRQATDDMGRYVSRFIGKTPRTGSGSSGP